MIAITFALPEESQSFLPHLSHPGNVLPGPLPCILGNLGTLEILVCHTGVGAQSAQRRLTAALDLHKPRLLIAAGFAGGLDPTLAVGDIVAAKNASDAALLERAARFAAKTGTLLTRDEPVVRAEEKAALYRETAASAVDMETETIAFICNAARIPVLAVRAISDPVGVDFPVPYAVMFDTGRQRPRPLRLCTHLVRNRAAIAPFAQFVHDVHAARESLTSFLLRLVRDL